MTWRNYVTLILCITWQCSHWMRCVASPCVVGCERTFTAVATSVVSVSWLQLVAVLVTYVYRSSRWSRCWRRCTLSSPIASHVLPSTRRHDDYCNSLTLCHVTWRHWPSVSSTACPSLYVSLCVVVSVLVIVRIDFVTWVDLTTSTVFNPRSSVGDVLTALCQFISFSIFNLNF